MELLPDDVRTFLSLLKDHGVIAEPQIEKGGDRAGDWWIDFDGLTVEWRPGFGFGFSLGADLVYGEGPSEIFKIPSRAAIRAKQLLMPRSEFTPSSLRAVRELYGMTQGEVAARLDVLQAAVSRLEARSDSKIDTLSGYIEALGGHLELRAVFPDAQLPIHRSPNVAFHGSLESHRASLA